MSQFGKNVLNDRPASLLLEDSPVELHRVANQEKARRRQGRLYC